MYIVFFRTILLYILIVFSLRLMGKRQLGELQPSELVVTILISNIASLPIEDTNIPLTAGAVPILVLVAFEIIISTLSLKSLKFRRLITGNTKIIIKDGAIDQKILKELRFSIDDLMEELRSQDVFDLREVQLAIVETGGQINIFKRPGKQEVTAEMLNIKAVDSSPPVVVISDGEFINEGIAFCNSSKEKINEILKLEGYELSKVFIMTLDASGDYYIVKKEKG